MRAEPPAQRSAGHRGGRVRADPGTPHSALSGRGEGEAGRWHRDCCGSRGGLEGGWVGSGAAGLSAARSASILRRAAAGRAAAAEAPQS